MGEVAPDGVLLFLLKRPSGGIRQDRMREDAFDFLDPDEADRLFREVGLLEEVLPVGRHDGHEAAVLLLDEEMVALQGLDDPFGREGSAEAGVDPLDREGNLDLLFFLRAVAGDLGDVRSPADALEERGDDGEGPPRNRRVDALAEAEGGLAREAEAEGGPPDIGSREGGAGGNGSLWRQL